jgi:hypothetical protein
VNDGLHNPVSRSRDRPLRLAPISAHP